MKNLHQGSFLKNYFVYLSVFTFEIIAVVVYFTWTSKQMLIGDAIAKKYGAEFFKPEEIEIIKQTYREAIYSQYLMAAIIIISVSALAVIIDKIMRNRFKEIERLSYLEGISKDSEKVLHNEAKYRSLFENNGTAILVVGDNELISDCNAKFEELIGFSKKEMINILHWTKIVHPDDIGRVSGYDKLRRTYPDKAPAEYLMKMIRKNGAVRQVIVTVIVLQGTEQLASIVDITEMLEKDKALKENQELLKQAQEIASMGSWSYSLAEQKLIVSDEFISMLGLDGFKEEISLDLLRNTMHFEQFYRTVTGMINNINGTDTEISYLETRQGLNSKTFYFKIKGRVIYEDEKPVMFIGILQDITDRKIIENEVNRTNKDLKNLLYVASHDLQIPLISIEGFASILDRAVKDNKLSSEYAFCIERIVNNTKQMSSLFKNFFDISKVGHAKNTFELFSMTELINKAVSDNKLLTDKFGAKIFLVDSPKLPNVYGDRENILLLISHLISNAVKYGGKNIYIGYDDVKGFFVKDDGRGIDPADREKIFLPGVRLDEKSIQGSGMGLTFCRKVADIHNGKIYAESEGNNKGSVFYFMPSYELIRN